MTQIITKINSFINNNDDVTFSMLTLTTSGLQIEHSIEVPGSAIAGTPSGLNTAIINGVKKYVLDNYGVQNEPGEKTILFGSA